MIAMFDIILAMTIHTLVIDGAFDVCLTNILDSLSLVGEWADSDARRQG